MWGRRSIMRTMVDIVLDVYTRTATLHILHICTFAHPYISLQVALTCPTQHCEKLAEAKDYPIRSSSYTKQIKHTNRPKSTNPAKCGVKLSIHVSFVHKGKRKSPKRTISIPRSFFYVLSPSNSYSVSIASIFSPSLFASRLPFILHFVPGLSISRW